MAQDKKKRPVAKKKRASKKRVNPATAVTQVGRDSTANFGVVNPPVYHASTVLFPTLADLERISKEPFDHVYYGRHGTPTSFAFEQAVAELEGGHRSIATNSGLAAITGALMAFVRTGDHVLVPDSAYSPTRKFCDTILKGFGVETTYYDPLIGTKIKGFIQKNTKVVFTEAPGSLTFEVSDIPAIAKAAHAAKAVVMMDNSWATPIYFAPFDHGVDVSIQAGTKYLVGHSDAMIGSVTTNSETLYKRIKASVTMTSGAPSPDDCYLALRGIRTLAVRLDRHQETGLKLAHWLKRRPEVSRILHPAFTDCPGHKLWLRDFTGASGLFSIVLAKHHRKKALAAMLDNMALFKMGYSWGGFESLILPANPETIRTASPWQADGTLLRLHAGLEDPDDLIEDLDCGFARLNRA